MKSGCSSSFGRPAAMEKQRRDQMKELYLKLAALLQLPSHERMPLLALLDQATISIKQQKERVEGLKARKQVLEKERGQELSNVHLQIVKVSEIDSNLEVNLIVTAKVNLFRVLSIIQQCGAEIVSCNFSTIGHQTHYTIHAQAIHTRLGFDSSEIESRLKELIFQTRQLID